MNEKETILMLEAQLRRMHEILKDPLEQIRKIERESAWEIARLKRQLAEKQQYIELLSQGRKEIHVHVHEQPRYDGPDWPGVL